MSENTTSILQAHLARLAAGDDKARDALVNHACANMARLAERMLAQFPGVRRWEDADDVQQNAALRPWSCL